MEESDWKEIKHGIDKDNDINYKSKLLLENQIKQVETKVFDSSNLQYLFLNLLTCLEKSVDILWIFYIELENVYLKDVLKTGTPDFGRNVKEFQDSGKIMGLINDFKFIKGILNSFVKEKGNVTEFKDLQLGNLEHLEPFLAVNEVILGIFPDLKLDKQLIFTRENSKYHHSFFLYAQEKELEICELKEQLKVKSSTDSHDSGFQEIKNSNIILLQENQRLKKEIKDLQNEGNYEKILQIAELKFKSFSNVDLAVDQELKREISREKSDFTQVVKELEQMLTIEHDKILHDTLSKNGSELKDSLKDLRMMFSTLESMDSKMNLLAQSGVSDHLVLAENCLEELRIVKEALRKISANTLLSPVTESHVLCTSPAVDTGGFEKTIHDLQDENEKLRNALASIKETSFSDSFKDISSVATQVALSEHDLVENDKNRIWEEMQRLCDELSTMHDTNKNLDAERKSKDEEIVNLQNQIHNYEIAYDGSQKQIMKMANEESNYLKEKAELVEKLKQASASIEFERSVKEKAELVLKATVNNLEIEKSKNLEIEKLMNLEIEKSKNLEVLKAELVQNLKKSRAKNLELETSVNYSAQENKSLVRQLHTLKAVTKSAKRENHDMYEVLLETQVEEQDFVNINQQLTDSLEGLQREFTILDEKLCDKTEINNALSSKIEDAQKFIADLTDKCQRVVHDLDQSNKHTLVLETELDKSRNDSHTFQFKLREVDIALRDQIKVNKMQQFSLDQARGMMKDLSDRSKNLATQLHDKIEINKVLSIKIERDQKNTEDIQRSLLETTLKLKKTQEQLKSNRSTAQRLSEELTSTNERNQSLKQKLTDSKSTIHRLEEDLNASNQGIKSLNLELSESQSSAQKLKEKLNSEKENNETLKLRLEKSKYAAEKILEEINVMKERSQALNMQHSESESIIMKLNDELKASNELNQSLRLQLSETHSTIQKLEEELIAANKIRADSAHIESLEKSVYDIRLDYEASSKRSSILIRENSQLKGQVHETEALNTALNMEIAVLNQKLSKLHRTFHESKELLQIPIIIQKAPKLEIKEYLPELSSPSSNIKHSDIKELEGLLCELPKLEKLESDKLAELTAQLGKLSTQKCSKKKSLVDNLHALQRNMNENSKDPGQSVQDYENQLARLDDQHRLETRKISQNEESLKVKIELQSKTLKSLKEKKRNLKSKLNNYKKEEFAQKKFFRNQINQFNNEYMRDIDYLNAHRSELFNNLQTFEQMLESLVNSKEKMEFAYKNELDKLETNHRNSQLYNMQLKLLNFSFDTEFLILNGKEESMNQNIKKLKNNIKQLEEAKSNFKELRDNAESHVISEYKVNFEESISGLEDIGVVLDESKIDDYEDNALQHLSRIVELLSSQNDENRILDEMAFMNMRNGYEARIKEINNLRDETIRVLNESHSEAICELSNNLKSLSKEHKRKEEALVQELHALKQAFQAKNLSTETIIADQEQIISDASQQLDQYKKETENFQLIMNNIMDLQARETETISLRESRKFKSKLKNILDNAKELKLQKEELESKFQVCEMEKIDWAKKVDQLKISNNHLSKQNELLSHELHDSKIMLRMKSLDELESLPKEKTVEEKERILDVLSAYKAIQLRIQEDLAELKSIETENTSKEVIYFVQIGYETFLEVLKVIIQYLSADVGIIKNSVTDLSEIQVSKIRNKILSVENIVNYASRVFSLSQESASLYQFVSHNEIFKDALKAKYNEASIKPSPSMELLMDQGLTNLLAVSNTAEKGIVDIMEIITQRNHYKKSFDELKQQLASKVSESVESQTENHSIGDKELQTSRIIEVDQQLQTSQIICKSEDVQTSQVLCGDSWAQTDLNIQEYDTKINKLQNDLEKVISEKKFLKSSYMHSQEEQSKAYRLADSYRLEKDKLIAEKESLQKQIPILESLKHFIEQRFKQCQEELGKAKSKIDQLKEDMETVSLEKSNLQSTFVQNQSQIANMSAALDQLRRDYKSKEDEKISVDARYSRTQIEVEQYKSKISQAEKKSKALESEIDQLKEDMETVSLEKSNLQSTFVQNQSQIANMSAALDQLRRDYKSKEDEKISVDARYSRTQIEVEQYKSKISQAEKKSKALESESYILQTNLDSLSLQLAESIRDANDLRSLNQKFLSEYNSLVDQLFQKNGKGSRNLDEQNIATTLKELNYLLDEARSNEIVLSKKLKERNSTINDLSEKIRISTQENLDNERDYQKTINDLSLQHIQALEAKDKSILVLEDKIVENKHQRGNLLNKLKALELKEETLEKNIQTVKKELSDKLESNISSGVQLQTNTAEYIRNIFSDLEKSLENSQNLAIEGFILNLVEFVQMKILKPDISRNEESKILFKQVSYVLIGLESLLSKIQIFITEKNLYKSKQLNHSVSIISGIVNAATLLEDFTPLAKIVSQHMECFKKSLLDNGVTLWIDQKIQFEVADAIRMAIEQSKKAPNIVLKSPVRKALPSPKVLSPETPLIKDILNSPSASAQKSDESWLVDQDLKHVHQITKQSIMDTIGTLSSAYKNPMNFSKKAQLSEDFFNEGMDSLEFDAELARMKTITDMNMARTLHIASSLKPRDKS